MSSWVLSTLPCFRTKSVDVRRAVKEATVLANFTELNRARTRSSQIIGASPEHSDEGSNRRLDERRNLRGIFLTRGRLDAACDVDHPRLNTCNFRRDVLRR
jgi:hypothetical protein